MEARAEIEEAKIEVTTTRMMEENIFDDMFFEDMFFGDMTEPSLRLNWEGRGMRIRVAWIDADGSEFVRDSRKREGESAERGIRD
jgi:hypothetical protein